LIWLYIYCFVRQETVRYIFFEMNHKINAFVLNLLAS